MSIIDWHGLDSLNINDVYVMRKPWIGAIRGLRSSNHGSKLCVGNPRIVQLVRDPWNAQLNAHVFSWICAVSLAARLCSSLL